MNAVRASLVLGWVLITFVVYIHAQGLPKYVQLPASARIDQSGVVDENYGEARIWLNDDPEIKRGRHLFIQFALQGLDEAAPEAVWAPIRTSLTSAGWTVVRFVIANPSSATLRYQRDGLDAFTTVTMFGGNDIRMDVIEVRPPALSVTLRPPGATPEKVADSEPFPYLTIAGAKLTGTERDGPPIFVTFKGDTEPTLVASGSVRKDFTRPERMSSLQFALEYRNALTKAGWQIVNEQQGIDASDALLKARYSANGRDLWAELHFGGDVTVAIADAGATNWSAVLEKDCHVPLVGVTFDFNKATLKPESEPTLRRAAAWLHSTPALTVEVQGHTDNVGGDAANLRLSQQRADTVMTWLVANGVAAGRLAAKGYGLSQPVADNGTDEGRARNRRVELAKPGCR